MNFSDLIVRLEKVFRVITLAAIALSIIEALIVLFIGIASSNIATPNPNTNSVWLGILIFLVIVDFPLKETPTFRLKVTPHFQVPFLDNMDTDFSI